jgi:ankyrin repeat protein
MRAIDYSVQEHFDSAQMSGFRRTAHRSLANACMGYLFSGLLNGPSLTRRDLYRRIDANALLEYAANHWGLHVRLSETLQDSTEVLELLQDRAVFSGTAQISQYDKKSGRGIHNWVGYSAVHAAAHFDLEITLQHLRRRRQLTINSRDRLGRTPLECAVLAESTGIVEGILAENRRYSQELLNFARQPHTNSRVKKFVMKILLDRKIIVFRGSDAQFGPLLLERYGVSGTRPNEAKENLLYHAAGHGDAEIVAALLAKDTNVNFISPSGDTPLWNAIRNNRDSVVKLLVDRGDLNINFKSKEGRPPISYILD